MLVAASHLVIGLIGAVLLYVALFLHETEEGKLQNRLEELWIEIDDLSKAALSKQTAFLRQVSAMANSALNRLFGVRLFSIGAVSASSCFSIGSVLLFVASGIGQSGQGPKTILITLVAGILCFLVGVSPVPLQYLGLLLIPGSMVLLLWADWSKVNWRVSVREGVPLLLAVCGGGYLSDILFIAISRWCLRKSSELKNGLWITCFVILNGCIGLVLIGPMLWGIVGVPDIDFAVEFDLFLLGASNLVTGLISFLFILLATVALAHLIVWPILERPLYSLQRYGLVRQPKMLAAASVTCLVFAWPHSLIIHAITKLVHG